MVAKQPASSAYGRQSEAATDRSHENEAVKSGHKYVIQRTGETYREWWTGTGWSVDENSALQYPHEPDASIEANDEAAKAIRVEDVDD